MFSIKYSKVNSMRDVKNPAINFTGKIMSYINMTALT